MVEALTNVIGLTYGGSLRRGGWESTIRIAADGDALTDWQIVEIWQRDFWNGFDEGWNRVMKGYTLPKEIKRDWKRGDFDVITATSHRMLRNMECQYIAFKQGGPANAHEMVDLRLGKMIQHVLDSHTNIIFHATNNPEGWAGYSNVNLTVGGAFPTWFGLGRERGLIRIWPTIVGFAKQYGLITYFDKYDNLFWGPHPMFDSPLPGKVVTFTQDFWTKIRILKLGQEKRVRQVIMTGDQDDGTTIAAAFPPLTADTYWYYGHDEFGRVRCNDPTELLAIANRKQRFANRDYDVVLETWGLWDLEIGDRVGITYTNVEDGISGGSAWVNKDFYVESIQVRIDLRDPRKKRKKTKIVLNEGVGTYG